MSIADINPDIVGPVADALAATKVPALSSYELGRILFASGINSGGASWRERYAAMVEALESVRLLKPIKPLKETRGFLLFGRLAASVAEIACSIDPFAYVSHLSAMEHHGLTDRFPKLLYLCTPKATEWRLQARLRMEKDLAGRLADYEQSGLPRLMRPRLTRLGSVVVQIHERSHLGAFRTVADSPLRVATMGRVFLDMLREPQLCGGIQHVLDVYREHAPRYLRLIVSEIDQHGNSIDKVRAGYVLGEVCKVSDPAIDHWESFAQRGGSRRLDADSDYSSHYSERWKLSINVPSLVAEFEQP
ncbi:MAG: type IV toxin-antitoxin system AbiEi family antitoxin domain-containing protein [Panacagrimonas sp.]